MAGAGVAHLYLQSHGAGSRLHVSQRALRGQRISRIDEHRHTSGRGHHLTQESQPLPRQLTTVKIDTRRVAARSSKASAAWRVTIVENVKGYHILEPRLSGSRHKSSPRFSNPAAEAKPPGGAFMIIKL